MLLHEFNVKAESNVCIYVADVDNEMQIGWDNLASLVFVVQNTYTDLPLPADVTHVWEGWHKHCFTWRQGISIKVHVCTSLRISMVALLFVP